MYSSELPTFLSVVSADRAAIFDRKCSPPYGGRRNFCSLCARVPPQYWHGCHHRHMDAAAIFAGFDGIGLQLMGYVMKDARVGFHHPRCTILMTRK